MTGIRDREHRGARIRARDVQDKAGRDLEFRGFFFLVGDSWRDALLMVSSEKGRSVGRFLASLSYNYSLQHLTPDSLLVNRAIET